MGSYQLWCLRKSEEDKVASQTFKEKNKEVGLVVIRSFLKIVLEVGSSADFMKNIDFTHIFPGILKSPKNNSRGAFFELRDDCFEVVTEKVQMLFKSDKVTELSATLDKVTIQHRSFTVLLTFFFYGGKIYCVLNSLLKMAEEDYNATGTARMVVNNMKETLGLSRTQLASKLLHFR
jgi:hypothetical protein